MQTEINIDSTSITNKESKEEFKGKPKGFVLQKSVIKQGNLIKKVKTYSLRVYEKLLQSCLIAKKSFRLYNISNEKRHYLFKSFKADISRQRNSQLMPVKMKILFKHLIGFDLTKLRSKKNKLELFNYLINCSFSDIMKMIQRSQCDFILNSNKKFSSISFSKISYNDFKSYFSLMKEVYYSYQRKKNENDYYLKKYYEFVNKNVNNEANVNSN